MKHSLSPLFFCSTLSPITKIWLALLRSIEFVCTHKRAGQNIGQYNIRRYIGQYNTGQYIGRYKRISKNWLACAAFGITTAISCAWNASPLYAQDSFLLNQTGTVSKIEITGLEIVDQSYVRSILDTQEQAPLSPYIIANDVRKIYRLGFAQNVEVSITQERSAQWLVTFTIKEKPRINEIIFVGNKAIDDKTILDTIQSSKFSITNIEKIKRDVQAIQNAYKEKKYYQAKVLYQLEPVDNFRSNLVFTIIEDPKTYVTEIKIRGSKHFSSLELERRLITSKIDCFSWLNSSGTLDENRINQDLQILYQSYANEGFVKLQIFKPRVKVLEGTSVSKAIVEIYLIEGPQYSVGDIQITSFPGEDLLVDKAILFDLLQLKTGDIFNISLLSQDRATLDNFYQDRGYAFNQVSMANPIHEQEKKIDIIYEVKHLEKTYINRVNIEGNQSTYDYVVRRELSIRDTELFRSSKVQSSQTNLNQLGFFDAGTGVVLQKEQNADQTLDYYVKLKEAQTGSLNLSLTYSDLNGFGVSAQVAKRNLFGRGQSLSFKLNTTSRDNYSGDLQFTEYYLFGTRLRSTTSLSFAQFNSDDSSGDKAYTETDYTASQSFGVPIWLNWNLYLRLFVQQNLYSDISSVGKDLLDNKTRQEERGIGSSIEYNSVDNPLFSTQGVYASLGMDNVGAIPGGTEDYYRFSSRYQYFQSITDDKLVVFMGQARATYVVPKSSDNPIPTNKRLSAGGINTVRGFNYGQVQGATSLAERSPTFSSLGLKRQNPEVYDYYKLHTAGNRRLLFNLELLFPISRDQSQIRGVVFYDAGNVWSEKRMYEITGATLNYGYLKKSYGAGIRVITPAGVIRLEYANVIDPKPGENAGKAELYIGALF